MTEDRGQRSQDTDSLRTIIWATRNEPLSPDTRRRDAEAENALEEAKQKITIRRMHGDLSRNEKFRNSLNWIMIFGAWTVFLFILALVFSWSFHLMAPERCHYLTSAQLGEIRQLLTGGLISTVTMVLLPYIRRRLDG